MAAAVNAGRWVMWMAPHATSHFVPCLPGNLRRRNAIYAEVFGGETTIMVTMADSPVDFPADAADLIFNSELRVGDLVIKASDNPEGGEVGSSSSLFVTFTDPAIRQDVLTALAHDGEVLFALEGPFAMVRDRFGVQWMLILTPTTDLSRDGS